jgi:hypothetical protein
MRPFRKRLVVFLFCLVAIGFCRGWFSISSPSPDTEGDNVNVSVDNRAESDVAHDTKDRFL